MAEDKEEERPDFGEEPEDPYDEIVETPAFVFIQHNSEKDRYEIKGVVVVDFYGNGYAEVDSVEPPEFEKDFLEKRIYGMEDDYLSLVSDEKRFNQMLESHWNQLPLMFKSPYSFFVKTDADGLDKLIEQFGWRLDELEKEGAKPDEGEEDKGSKGE